MTAVLTYALALAAAANPCAEPASARPPDPRCGESLDGRAPAEPSAARKVGQAALAVPRVATQVMFWPIVETASFIEYHHVVDWARAILTTDDGLVGVRPDIQYSTSFAPTAGLRFFYRRLPGPGSELMLRARTAGPSIVLGQIGVQGPNWSGLSLVATFDRRNDRLFAGTGPLSSAELDAIGQGRARYASDNVAAQLLWSRRLPLRLVARAHGDIARRDYRSTDLRAGPSVADVFGAPAESCTALGLAPPCVDEAAMPGFHRGLRVVHGGLGLELDLRNPARDGSGVNLGTHATVARGVSGDPSRHALLSAETVAAIGGADRQLLLRARAAMVERLTSAPIPFDELVMPSGLADMRGFPTGRFRGESGLFGTAEYRWYISAYLDATLFADLGTVAGPRFAGLSGDRWFPSFGLGFRYYKPQGPYWEARARDGMQFVYSPDGGFRVLVEMAAF
jgi:hypothetical protein